MFASLNSRLEQVIPSRPIIHESLTVVPFVGPSRTEPDYALYGPECAAKVKVGEIGGSGVVRSVRVENTLDRPVFIIDGQQLIGAKQNRIVNADVMVPAKSNLDLPVSCVEQGRWRHESPHFAPSAAAPRKIRERKLMRVNDSVAAGHGFDAGQGEVWDDVAECMRELGVSSPSGCLTVAYSRKEVHLSSVREAVMRQLPPQTIGFAVFIQDWFRGMELFDRTATLNSHLGTVLDGYTMDWLAWKPAPRTEAPMGLRFLDRVQDQLFGRGWRQGPAVGLGADWRLSTPGLVASALEWESDVVHLQAFQRESPSGRRPWSTHIR